MNKYKWNLIKFEWMRLLWKLYYDFRRKNNNKWCTDFMTLFVLFAAWLCNCQYANNHSRFYSIQLFSFHKPADKLIPAAAIWMHFLFWLISTAAQIVFLQLPAPSLETAVSSGQNDGEDLFREPGWCSGSELIQSQSQSACEEEKKPSRQAELTHTCWHQHKVPR